MRPCLRVGDKVIQLLSPIGVLDLGSSGSFGARGKRVRDRTLGLKSAPGGELFYRQRQLAYLPGFGRWA